MSILGERYTHGHVFDFYQKLLADARRIEVLGNGKQRKSYLLVRDEREREPAVLGHSRGPDQIAGAVLLGGQLVPDLQHRRLLPWPELQGDGHQPSFGHTSVASRSIVSSTSA